MKRSTRMTLLMTLGALPMLLIVSAGRALGVQDEDPIESTRATLDKLVEIRQLIAKKRYGWKDDEQTLRDRIELVKSQIASYEQRIEESEASIQDAQKKKAELEAESQELETASQAFLESIVGFEAQTKDLLQRLPEPIAQKVRQLSQQLPEDPAQTEISISRRFQNVIGILNEVNGFNAELTPASEIRTLRDGSRASVSVLYFGLGQAYYVTTKADAAGIGTATADGWAWSYADESAPEIDLAMKIFRGEKPAAYVKLPVRIK
ncbi:MAG: DUF3450 family protein [Planctomycetota bacterium]